MWRGATREEGRKEEEEREKERERKLTQRRGEGVRKGTACVRVNRFMLPVEMSATGIKVFWSTKCVLDCLRLFPSEALGCLVFCGSKVKLQLHVLDPSQFGGHLDPLTSFLDRLIQLWPKSQNTLTQGTQVTSPCCVKQNGGAMKRMYTQSIPSFLRVVFFGTQLMWSSSRVTTHNLPETRKVSLKVKSVLDARWNEGIRLSPWLSPVGLRSRTVVLLSNTPWIPEVSVANDWLLLTSSVGTVESLTSSVGTVESLTSRVGTVESLTSRVGTVESQASSVGIVPFNRSPSSKVSKRGFDFT